MSADLIARLIEAGTPPALVAEVAMLAARAEADNQALADRRANDAVRQRNRRHAMSRDVTAHNVTTRDVTDETPSPSPALPPDPQPTLTHTPGDTPRARKGTDWPVPDGIDPDHWRDLLANRKSKRLPNTPTAHKQLLAALERLSDDEWPPGRIVEYAAGRGWGAIFDPRDRDHGKRSHQNGRTPGGHDAESAIFAARRNLGIDREPIRGGQGLVLDD